MHPENEHHQNRIKPEIQVLGLERGFRNMNPIYSHPGTNFYEVIRRFKFGGASITM